MEWITRSFIAVTVLVAGWVGVTNLIDRYRQRQLDKRNKEWILRVTRNRLDDQFQLEQRRDKLGRLD